MSPVPSTQGAETSVYTITDGLGSREVSNGCGAASLQLEMPLPDYEHPPAYDNVANDFEMQSITVVEHFI
ncbi:unnamed protein product [Allacma fusca]|uniref:Uncharacterized protein n=2 Tax=Allacma fusca TaxID=39272 RepID=A0A8J2KK59_9HEXA|nr:unnamed protein product [Allacma fusca]